LLGIHQEEIIPHAFSSIPDRVAGWLTLERIVNVLVTILVDVPKCRLALMIYNQAAYDPVLVPSRHPPGVCGVIDSNGCDAVRSGRV
jgi:hypothetical protein